MPHKPRRCSFDHEHFVQGAGQFNTPEINATLRDWEQDDDGDCDKKYSDTYLYLNGYKMTMRHLSTLAETQNEGFHHLNFIESKGPFIALITTRRGGISPAPFDTFNMSPKVGDESSYVQENRWRVARHLNTDPDHLITISQIHSDIIIEETGPDVRDFPADGHFVRDRNYYAVASVADCVPIFLADPRRKVIGVVHAGWRGLEQRIAYKAVLKMQHHFRTDPEDVLAVIGPSIGPCHYEVGLDVIGAFEKQIGFECVFYEDRNGKNYLNLWSIAHYQLMMAGIYPGHISIEHECTACKPDRYYSHRASGGKTGRMWAIVGLT